MPPFLGNELLEGELVVLTRPTREDAAAYNRWMNDIEYQRLLRRGMVYPSSVEEIVQWLSETGKDDQFFPFSIRRKSDRELIGTLAIKDVFWQARHCSFFIGIGEREERGKGYGKDAVRVMLKYAFLEMNMHRVGLEVLSYNEAAMRAYQQIGFKHEGTLRAFSFRDGAYYDMHLMGLLRHEWEALTGFTSVPYSG